MISLPLTFRWILLFIYQVRRVTTGWRQSNSGANLIYNYIILSFHQESSCCHPDNSHVRSEQWLEYPVSNIHIPTGHSRLDPKVILSNLTSYTQFLPFSAPKVYPKNLSLVSTPNNTDNGKVITQLAYRKPSRTLPSYKLVKNFAIC